MDPREAALRGTDLADLLGHIAYQETVKPELAKQKAYLSSLLTNAVLGRKVTQNGQLVNPEQLAGCIYGIDYITRLFEKILSRGEDAKKVLSQEQPFSVQ